MQPERKISVVTHCVGEESQGQRIDNFLLRVLKGVPKSHIYRLLRDGQVRVNGGRKRAEYRLCAGDRVRIPPVRVPATRAEAPAARGQRLEPRILYRDEALLALDKPAGWAVHGGSGIRLGIIEQLRQELPEQRFLELVHRLDRDTSGVLLVACKRSALTGLHAQMRAGSARKRYQALVCGDWREKQGEKRVETKLALRKFHTDAGERRVVVDPQGQPAHTVFRLVRHFPGYSLLEADLRTGRTHQIRVHLQALGFPIAGDDKYGDFEANRALQKQGLGRMFLHAASIDIAHPLTGAPLHLEASLAPELQRFLARIEAGENKEQSKKA